VELAAGKFAMDLSVVDEEGVRGDKALIDAQVRRALLATRHTPNLT